MSEHTAGLRLVTHNIYGRRAGWESRQGVLRDGLDGLDPDVVLLQEEILTPEYDQTAALLPPGWHVVHSIARSAQEASGISVASRWPMELVEEVDLTEGGPPVDEFAWGALIVRVETPSGPVLIVNHFPDATADREHERGRQAVIVERRIRALVADDGAPVVLAGDMDAEPDSDSLRFFTGHRSIDGESTAYVRAWDVAHPGAPCWTIDPVHNPLAKPMERWPYRQIDHVLIRCGDDGLASMHVESCDRIHDVATNGTWASDHYGLVADLTVPA